MTKTLKELAEDAVLSVESGYYGEPAVVRNETKRASLVSSILSRKGRAVISEIKFASPSAGEISKQYSEVSNISRQMETGGAAGLSVLTEPKNFQGSLENLTIARKSTSLPVIMKDIVVSKEQIAAGARIGANAVLFIEEIFSGGYVRKLSLEEGVRFAKEQGLEVIVESNSKEGLARAPRSGVDILGINNRDLRTFKINLETTIEILQELSFPNSTKTPLIMSESGFEKPSDVSELLRRLRSSGLLLPSAFLIGTAIMRSGDFARTTREFVEACDV